MSTVHAEQLDFDMVLAEFEAELGRDGRCPYQQYCNEEWRASAAYRCAWLEHHQVHLCPRFRQRERGRIA